MDTSNDYSTDYSVFSNALFKDEGEVNGPRITITDSSTLRPDTFEFPRINKEMLSLICIEGSLNLIYDDSDHVLTESTLLGLLAGHTLQGFKASPDFKGFMLRAGSDQITNFMPLMSRMLLCHVLFREEPVIKLTPDELATQRLFRDLIAQKQKGEDSLFNRMIVDKLVEALYCETINVYFSRITDQTSSHVRRRESIFYKFIQAVEKNYQSERSIAFYADCLCITPKHLSSVVKELTGKTPTRWIDGYVVSEIKRLLETTSLTIQEIGLRMNFANQSFLGKYFKNHTGISPREYRATFLKDTI